MYKYDHVDQKIVDERVEQYQNQLKRFLSKKLTPE
jgi:sulfite reductase (NADPH) hemoprotein beta-component